MSVFPRVRPVLGLASWCAFALAAFLASVTGVMLGTVAAAWVRG